MKKRKIIIALILFLLGFAGVLSLLTMDIQLSEATEDLLLQNFTSNQIKWLSLINPTLILLIAVVVGVILHEKVHLKVPIIEALVNKGSKADIGAILKNGLLFGFIAGIILILLEYAFYPLLSAELGNLSQNMHPSVLNRLLYGGITEEILLRFGLMTLLTWIGFKVFKNNKLIFWTAMILTALVFAAGHLPVVIQSIGAPSLLMVLYVLISNLAAGTIYGWLYWKHGLESAFTGHIFTHVVILVVISLKGLLL